MAPFRTTETCFTFGLISQKKHQCEGGIRHQSITILGLTRGCYRRVTASESTRGCYRVSINRYPGIDTTMLSDVNHRLGINTIISIEALINRYPGINARVVSITILESIQGCLSWTRVTSTVTALLLRGQFRSRDLPLRSEGLPNSLVS